MSDLKEGDLAPAIRASDENGELITLEEYRGKKVVLYFYPRDNTPGCTAEACDLRDNYSQFIEQGFDIIGVSADSEKSHQNFKGKYELPFRLISDTEKKVLKDFLKKRRPLCLSLNSFDNTINRPPCRQG